MSPERRRFANRAVRAAVDLPALPLLLADMLETLHVDWGRGPAAPSMLDWRHEWVDTDGSACLQLADAPATGGYHARLLLRAPGQCDFLMDADAGTVLVDTHGNLDPHTLEHLLIDQVLPRLLAGRGHLMVHASQVQLGTGSVLFVGSSGWGKSTLASLMHLRGHPALCDDCVLLEVRDGLLFATPSYPGLRLFQDSIEQAPVLSRQLSPVSDYSDKQRVIGLQLPPGAQEPQRVDAIYVLSDPALAQGVLDVQRMPSANACMALVEHSFRLDPTARRQTVQLLRETGQAALAAPVFSLRFPHDFTRQEALVEMLLGHIHRVSQDNP